METFLIAVAGTFVGLVLVVALGWFLLRRKLRGIGEVMAAVFQAGGIPPFRISLRPAADDPWNDAAAVDAATRSFEAAGYMAGGDFQIPEMERVALRGFWHPELGSFGVVTDHPQAGVFGDLVRLFRDRSLLTVSTAPETGMDIPAYASHVRQDLDITELESVGRLHEVLVERSEDREPVRKLAGSFTSVFVGAYEMEMNWRIERGGVTEAEVRRAAEIGGLDAPDESAICLVRKGWRSGIEAFIDEEVQKAFLAQGVISAADWEEKRHRLAIVHELGERDDRIDELASVLCEAERTPGTDDDDDSDEAYDTARLRVAAAFEGRTIRDGVAPAPALLPEKFRYEAVGSVDRPWPADFYLVPEGYDCV